MTNEKEKNRDDCAGCCLGPLLRNRRQRLPGTGKGRKGVEERTLAQGWHWLSSFKHVKQFPISQQQIVFSDDPADYNEEEHADWHIDAPVNGGMVGINLTVNYNFLPDRVVELYRRFNGMDGEAIVKSRVQNSVIAYVKEQTQAAPEVTLTFTEVNETVWATGTVNLRSGPSTEDEKVGALNKGNSVTRIGIGTSDYASWSKVKLSDGTEVYVGSSYLTTTKPSSQSSSKPSGGSTGSSGSSSGGQQNQGGGTIDPGTGGTIVNGSDVNKGIITDPSELDTGTSNPYSGYGEINIGYGGN